MRVAKGIFHRRLLNVILGSVRSPFLRRSTPFRAFKRLIGLLENAVNQALGGF